MKGWKDRLIALNKNDEFKIISGSDVIDLINEIKKSDQNEVIQLLLNDKYF